MIPPRPAAATAAAIQSSSLSSSSCFVYGTLMSPTVLEALIGRTPSMIQPAFLQNHARFPCRHFVFPGVVPLESRDKITYMPKPVSNRLPFPSELDSIGSTYVEGVLLTDLTPEEVKVFDWYEDTAYIRSIVSVWIPSTTSSCKGDELGLMETSISTTWKKQETNTYLWANPSSELDLDQDWDYQYFLQNKLEWYMENTVRPCRKQLDALKIGVRSS